MSTTRHSPAPWNYEYSPYTIRDAGADATRTIGDDLPAYEVFDADGNKVFDTNEDTPAELQEANACLASAAPNLLAALQALVEATNCYARHFHEHQVARAVILEATGVAI